MADPAGADPAGGGLPARPLVVVSNRGPVSFRLEGDEPVAKRGAGGLVSALGPLVPHTDTTWANTLEVATAMMGHLPPEVQYKILRGNAIRMLHLDIT